MSFTFSKHLQYLYLPGFMRPQNAGPENWEIDNVNNLFKFLEIKSLVQVCIGWWIKSSTKSKCNRKVIFNKHLRDIPSSCQFSLVLPINSGWRQLTALIFKTDFWKKLFFSSSLKLWSQKSDFLVLKDCLNVRRYKSDTFCHSNVLHYLGYTRAK